MQYMSKYLDKKKCKVDSVVAIQGITGLNLALTPLHSGFQVAQVLDVDYYAIWVPLVVDEGTKTEILKKNHYISKILEMGQNADYALVGIGTVEASPRTAINIIAKTDFKKILDGGAIGEILGHFFTIDGSFIHTGLEKRIISVNFPMKCPVIGVAGGPDKIKAIAGALRSGWLQGLVTDENTAKGLVKILLGRDK
jgi:DNA-binding transcriptional regulator LsrR (DeoR family)